MDIEFVYTCMFNVFFNNYLLFFLIKYFSNGLSAIKYNLNIFKRNIAYITVENKYMCMLAIL